MTKVEIESASPAESQPETASFSGLLPEVSTSTSHGLLRKLCVGLGLFLAILGAYLLTSPGRIDIVDGEARFDVARSLVVKGRPILTDPLIGSLMGIPGRGGLQYSFYGAPASVFGAPLVWLGLKHATTIERAQFMFSLTSSIFGAAIAPVLFLFYLELGVALRKAVWWTLVSSLATLLWPVSNSTFDNAQHAFFILAALYCAFLSSKRRSGTLAAVAGLCVAIAILYQEYFALLAPFLALAALHWKSESNSVVIPPAGAREPALARADAAIKRVFRSAIVFMRKGWDAPGDARSSCIRYILFGIAASLGVVLTFAYNDYRFGSVFNDGKFYHAGPPLLGDPLLGLLTLLISPGKSIFLYSPTLALGILGFGSLRRRTPEVAVAIAAAGAVLVLFLSCIACVGGDWCWGPRYLTPLLPLFALAFPFANLKLRREAILTIVVLGLLVQVLALSVENQRFFFEKGLNDFFWWETPGYYLTHSALFARFGEIVSLRRGVPPSARYFVSAPLHTYSLLGPPPSLPRSLAPVWMQQFKIYYLPRPWPLWMANFAASARPINIRNWVMGIVSIGLLGTNLILFGFRTKECV